VAEPLITFLSDYGLEDEFVGVCHAVMAGICPQARVIDLAHGVRRYDIRQGAVLLAGALPYLPVAVHLAVVDPGVGGPRRAVAVRLDDGRLLVGPDNGLLAPAAQVGGGAVEAVEISASPWRLEPVSATFHGRDLFAPVAAALARGEPLSETGTPLDPAALTGLELPRPRISDGVLVAHVRYIDRFGNLQLNAAEDLLPEATGGGLEIETVGGERHPATRAVAFADVPSGELLVYDDAQQRLSVAVSQGDAAQRLGLALDDELRIRARPS
jgi:hypothetical protein